MFETSFCARTPSFPKWQVSRVGRRSEIVRLSHSSPVRLLPMATAAAELLGLLGGWTAGCVVIIHVKQQMQLGDTNLYDHDILWYEPFVNGDEAFDSPPDFDVSKKLIG